MQVKAGKRVEGLCVHAEAVSGLQQWATCTMGAAKEVDFGAQDMHGRSAKAERPQQGKVRELIEAFQAMQGPDISMLDMSS